MTAVNYLWNPINDNIVEEFDDAGNTIAEYSNEPDQFGDVISQYRDGQESFYHTDGLGSTLALTNSNGDVTDTYAYSAFGEVTARAGSTINPFQYIGQKGYYRDTETGQYDVRQRPLLTEIGRWLSFDPQIEDLDAYERYLYASNSPTILLDPSGLKPIEICNCRFTTAIAGEIVGYALGGWPEHLAIGKNGAIKYDLTHNLLCLAGRQITYTMCCLDGTDLTKPIQQKTKTKIIWDAGLAYVTRGKPAGYPIAGKPIPIPDVWSKNMDIKFVYKFKLKEDEDDKKDADWQCVGALKEGLLGNTKIIAALNMAAKQIEIPTRWMTCIEADKWPD